MLWLGPVIRPVERIVRPRLPFVLSRRAERLLGVFLLAVAVALFAPLPLVSYPPPPRSASPGSASSSATAS